MPPTPRARVLIALALVAAGLAAPTGRSDAQAPAPAEAPALPFDDAGRLREITPGVADRLGLRKPWWPVSGEYRRARLQREDGAVVLAIERFDGRLERLPLTDDQVAALRLEVTARAGVLLKPALATAAPAAGPTAAPAAGPTAAEPAAAAASAWVAAEPPLPVRAFMTRELVLGTAVFGPLAWASTSSPAFSPSAYLATAGLTFLAALNAQRVAPFSAPAADLGMVGGLGGAAAGYAVARAGRARPRGEALAALAGGVAGHVGGLVWGRRAGEDEARGAVAGVVLAAATTAGVLGSAGDLQAPSGSSRGRTAMATLALGGLVGAPLGRAYVRHVAHRITRGDVVTSAVTTVVGAAIGRGLAGHDSRRRHGFATVGGLLGVAAGDRLLSAPYDHGLGDAGLVAFGAAAGAAVAALPYAIDGRTADDRMVALAGAGAVLGIWGAEVIARPASGRRRLAHSAFGRDGRVRVDLDPAALLFAAARTPGSFPVVRVTF